MRVQCHRASAALKSATNGTHTVQSFYAPDGARYKRVDSAAGKSTTTLYIGSVEKVYRADGTSTWRRDISGHGQVVQEFAGNGRETSKAVHYFLKDQIGSVVAVLNESGIVADTLAYDPWHKRRNAENWQDSLQQENLARYSIFATPSRIWALPAMRCLMIWA